ncbi:MAG: ABC-type transport system involved in multi-copper enzyme maturation permease subunit [Myxococcota bacterium]|jgi:ABC-type transport system involved in multi-copper enzyme maturation permease subunit
MVPSNMVAMVWAELQTVFRRGSGLAALGVSLLLGLAVVALMGWVQQNAGGAEVNGAPIGEMVRYTGADCAGWALSARNFFVLPLLLLLATGGSVAGELQDRSLREVLIRPVPRWSVLAAKLIALLALSAATLLLSLLPSLLLGTVLYGADGPTVDVLLGYAASLGTDLGIIAFGFVASTVVHSVGGVVVSVILLLMLDAGARLLLWVRELLLGLMQQSVGAEVEPIRYSRFLPGAALDCWKGWTEGWTWEPFAGLVVLITVSLAVAVFRFQRMDVS